jgi:DNA-binding CsgD family transcriptional regulator
VVRQSEPDESQILSVIDRIYAAATEASRWPCAVSAVAEMVGATIAVAGGNSDIARRQPIHVGVGFRDDLADDYREHPEHWVPENPYIPVIVRRAGGGGLVDCREHVTARDVRRTLFYEDWMRPQGLGAGAVGSWWPASSEGPGGGIAVYPTARSGEFSPQQMRLLEVFDRHLIRAANTCAKLGFARAERDALLDALDRLEPGVLLVGTDGRVLSLNRAGEEILRAADGLAVRRGELVAARVAETRRLRDAVAAAVLERAASPPFVLPRPSGRRPYEVAVSPLRRRLSDLHGALAVGVVFVTDPERRAEPAEEVLAALYGLTPAEARVAAALASGLSVREYAERAERSVETVRTLVKRVLAKTGTSRQAELVALVAAGPAALRDDDAD